MNQLIALPYWPHLVTLALSLVLGAPASSDSAACEAAVVDYYAKHDTPYDMADAYTASKTAIDHAKSKGYKAAIAALRFQHESGTDTSSDLVIVEAAQTINAAAAAAGEAAEAAEVARALWIALGAGTSRHSAVEAVNIEHAAFASFIRFHQAGRKSVLACISAIPYTASRVDRGKYLDITSSVMDADSVAAIFESLAELDDIGIVGLDEFLGAVKAFYDATEEASLRAKNAATTLEIMSSSDACS